MKNKIITQEKVDIHETTSPLLEALYREMQELAKKKPEATLSEAKVKLINRLLVDIRLILTDEPELKYLDLIDTDALPQYSDVVLVLSQYHAAMKSFHQTYYAYDAHSGRIRWAVGSRLSRL